MAAARSISLESKRKFLPAVTTNRLILALLAIRILMGAMELAFYSDEGIFLSIVSKTYTLMTYLLTAILIWRERDHLSLFFIGKLAVLIFIVGKPYQLLAGLLGLVPYVNLLPLLPFLPIAIGLFYFLWKNRPLSIANAPHIVGWSLVGILAGIAFAFFVAHLNDLQGFINGYAPSIKDLFFIPSVQLGNAAIYEEPLFRGFLWGYLRQRGWKDLPILLVQASLFWLSHPSHAIYYPLSFWIVCPLAGLLLGLIAWRARDIAPSMFAHGLIDGLGQILG